MQPTINLDIKVPFELAKGDFSWVAHCPAFQVSSQGDTKEDAKDNLIEALTLFITTCYEMGTLSDVLKECGFVPVSEKPQLIDAHREVDFIDVPLPFVINEEGSSYASYNTDKLENF